MSIAAVSAIGSSPHTRGARADSPGCPGVLVDHPRIRGEHCHFLPFDSSGAGSSPHTRGARPAPRHHPRRRWIIPAYAGSTPNAAPRTPTRPDHPRIRGEHWAAAPMTDLIPGSSPHTRGAQPGGRLRGLPNRIIPAYAGSTRALRRSRFRCPGSSPHTRGALGSPEALYSHLRIIPAYAGST